MEHDFCNEDTLNWLFGNVKLQFLSAAGQHRIESYRKVGTMSVGSLPDVAATKLKTIGDRGELRDYYDLLCIEQIGQVDTIRMLDWYRIRYGLGRDHQSIYHIVRALGSFHDVADDPWLSESLGEPKLFDTVTTYWRRRQLEIAKRLF